MKRIITMAVMGLAALALAAPVLAADPPPPQPVTPFPTANSGDVFVIAHAVVTDGAISNYFAPGSTVNLRAYAVDGKTSAVLTAKNGHRSSRPATIAIVNQPAHRPSIENRPFWSLSVTSEASPSRSSGSSKISLLSMSLDFVPTSRGI